MSSLFQHQIKLRRRMWMKKYYISSNDVLSSLGAPSPSVWLHHIIPLDCCEHICSWEPKMNDEAMLKANIYGAQNIYRSISYSVQQFSDGMWWYSQLHTLSYLNVPMCNMVDVFMLSKMNGYVCLVNNACIQTAMMWCLKYVTINIAYLDVR